MKTKNKKLFALLMLPAVIAMMVLPLCSFTTTTTDPTDYSIYESFTQCDLSYRYHRSNYGFYNGTIPSANRILIDPTQTSIAGIRDSVKFYACDLFMGDSTKSIDIRSFSVSSLPSRLSRNFEDDLVLGICYRTDDYLYSQLDSIFRFWNFSFSDAIYIEPYDVNYAGYNISDAVNFYGWVTVNIAKYNYSLKVFEYDSFNLVGTLDDFYKTAFPGGYTSDTIVFDLNCIVQTVLDTYDLLLEDLGVDYYITNVELCLDYVPTDGSTFLGYGAVRLNSRVIEKTFDGLSYGNVEGVINSASDSAYNEGFSAGEAAGYSDGYRAGEYDGYSEGYKEGQIKGHADLKNAWGSLDDFLTSTVGSFFSFELWDGFSLGGVMAIIVGALLFVAFLKVFAGG